MAKQTWVAKRTVEKNNKLANHHLLNALVEFLTKSQAFKTTWQIHPTQSANRLVAPFKDGVVVQNVASEWLWKMGKVVVMIYGKVCFKVYCIV